MSPAGPEDPQGDYTMVPAGWRQTPENEVVVRGWMHQLDLTKIPPTTVSTRRSAEASSASLSPFRPNGTSSFAAPAFPAGAVQMSEQPRRAAREPTHTLHGAVVRKATDEYTNYNAEICLGVPGLPQQTTTSPPYPPGFRSNTPQIPDRLFNQLHGLTNLPLDYLRRKKEHPALAGLRWSASFHAEQLGSLGSPVERTHPRLSGENRPWRGRARAPARTGSWCLGGLGTHTPQFDLAAVFSPSPPRTGCQTPRLACQSHSRTVGKCNSPTGEGYSPTRSPASRTGEGNSPTGEGNSPTRSRRAVRARVIHRRARVIHRRARVIHRRGGHQAKRLCCVSGRPGAISVRGCRVGLYDMDIRRP
eukprot:953166-Prorocentrum_minimum.AAC.1